jgi:hypothetical protein
MHITLGMPIPFSFLSLFWFESRSKIKSKKKRKRRREKNKREGNVNKKRKKMMRKKLEDKEFIFSSFLVPEGACFLFLFPFFLEAFFFLFFSIQEEEF